MTEQQRHDDYAAILRGNEKAGANTVHGVLGGDAAKRKLKPAHLKTDKEHQHTKRGQKRRRALKRAVHRRLHPESFWSKPCLLPGR
ncbi:hypothetical protein SDC9_172614 [bioreactor metagenome]|uniref:Uncharacterized protein n=1 Tax=bioreactor metagenome TaxID=1076179 RepID=A0A645GE69_9ZZZZ